MVKVTVATRPRIGLAPGSVLSRWGRWVSRRRWPVLVSWALIIVVCAMAFAPLERRLTAMDFGIAGSESEHVDAVLAQHFPQLGAEQDVIVYDGAGVSVDSPEFRQVVDQAVAAARSVEGAREVTSPYDVGGEQMVSPNDRGVAVGLVGIDGDMADRAMVARTLQHELSRFETAQIKVAVTGYSLIQNDATEIQNSDAQRAEMIGIPVALILLVVALGAVTAAVVPVVAALVGLLLTAGTLFVLTAVTDFDSLTMSVATMIGIGVGIDYAMFIVSRYREELNAGAIVDRSDQDKIDAAVARTLATTGRTILSSGVIVMISLASLVVIPAPIFRGIAIGVATAVTAMLVVGLCLLPALLAVLGPRINCGQTPRRWQPAELSADLADAARTRWGQWAYRIMKRPALYGSIAVAILLLAALPLTGIRYGLDMGTASLSETPSGRAAATLTTHFPPGALSPVELVATDTSGGPLTDAGHNAVARYLDQAQADPRVAALGPSTISDGRLATSLILSVPFDSTAATDLITDLRSSAQQVGADSDILIGGSTAEFVDLDNEMTAKLPIVIGLVLTVSFVFLIVAFRSIALPLKAILMNLLATGAALGITVVVFQWGIGESLLDFSSPGFIQTYLPTLVFAVLFGLSMDYEVFLIGRMREYWAATGDNQHAVAAGLAHTARPITAAAAIMVVVFGSFITANMLELKQIGFALAIAVAIDALLVRLILVPALMRLLGQWNWWLPRLPRNSARAAPEGTTPISTPCEPPG